MPVHKVSTFLSEISTFFKKNNAEGAMFTIVTIQRIAMQLLSILRTEHG